MKKRKKETIWSTVAATQPRHCRGAAPGDFLASSPSIILALHLLGQLDTASLDKSQI